MDAPTRHLLLRDRDRWLGQAAGTASDRDGALTLMRVPGPEDGRAADWGAPGAREVSGLALGPCDSVFVADTAHGVVWFVEPRCDSRARIAGWQTPRGLALSERALLVADSAGHRVQSVALPLLEPDWAPYNGGAPASVAVDTRQRTVLIDAAARRLHRLSAHGLPDTAFDAVSGASGRLGEPLFTAIGPEDTVLVSDALHDRVDVFAADGSYGFSLHGPAGWKPGAIAVEHGGAARIYVADAADGRIRLFDAAGELRGSLPGWHGPVTALAIAPNGDLYIKPGLDDRYLRFAADTAFLDGARIEAGPFDAGVEREWERAWVEGDVPAGTAVEVELAQAASDAVVPPASEWHSLPGPDALLAPLHSAPGARRFLWLRIRLASADPSRTPVLYQVRAATAAEDLRDHLPATYRRNDPDGTLQRLLQWMRGEFLAVEERIDDMPRVADPDFAPATQLNWLSQWLAFELPRIADDGQRRELLREAVALMARRGTPASIAAFVEWHTGIRPAIFESQVQRRLWVLGESSALGFDTQLPPLDPNGMVVPDLDTAVGCPPLAEGEPPVGRAVVGESGPLAAHLVGLPLFAEDAYRFCVVVDRHRLQHAGTLQELQRIVDREKPAHTDYRVSVVEPQLCVGLQALVGVDTIVGGPPPAWQLDGTRLGFDAHLNPPDGALRVGEAVLGESMQWN
ncbi:MAG: phage tail protein [Pseudomonadota bacterium]